MNAKTIFIAITVFAMFIFTSCNKDDETNPFPVISSFELGYDNNKIGYAGKDLHLEAEIIAEGNINTITIQIYPQGEKTESWEIDTTYTEFSGDKNTTFHKHVDIPAYAEIGYCNFFMIVSDMEGQETILSDTLEIQYPDDDTPPEISVTSAPTENQVFTNGETISISGTVSDNEALGGLYIGLVRTDQELSDSEVDATNTITLLHTHDFNDPENYEFSADIIVGATMDNNITPKEITGDIAWQSSDYYIVIKCKDAYGANWSFSEHYPIIINY